MARLPRINYKAGIYFITVRGNNKENIFANDDMKTKFKQLLLKYKKRYGFYILTYCIMSNHAHILIQIGDFTTGKIMHAQNSAYSKWYNYYMSKNIKERTGHVFERRYHCNLICNYNYFLEAVRYTVQNPLKANMVSDIKDYQWSSHVEFNGEREDNICDRDRLFELLGDGNIKGGKELYYRIIKKRSIYEFEDFVSNRILGKIEYSNVIDEKQAQIKIDISPNENMKTGKKGSYVVKEREAYAHLLFFVYRQTITYIAATINKSVSAVSKMLERFDKKHVLIN